MNRVQFILCAAALLATAQLAHATLSFTNGSFENINGATGSFTIDNTGTLAGWHASPTGNQIEDCLDYHGNNTSVCGTVFNGTRQFWVNPGPSPDGGNFVAIDADSDFATPLTQSVSGLIVGQKYVLTFYQASAQFTNETGKTTEQFQVTFGSGAANQQTSTLMKTPSKGSIGWALQTMTFTATNTTQTLSFLAEGGPAGLPPFALLDGVNLRAQTPEPVAFGMVGVGLVGISLIAKRVNKRRS
jgi:hypothetical protein